MPISRPLSDGARSDGALSDAARLDAALVFAIGRLREVWHRRLRACDLTPPQGITLRMLADGPVPMRAVADVLACDASNLTGIADRLEERGLAVRTADPADRRVKLLTITAKGLRVLAEIDAPIVDEFTGITELGDAERAQLASLLLRAFR